MIIDSIEKRRKTIRYPAVAYAASVRRLRVFSRFSQPYPADVIDFHSDGVGLFSENKFAVGNRVELTIHSARERVSHIRGVVCYVRCRRNGYWFGVKFVNKVKGKPVDPSVLIKLERLMQARLA